MVNRKIYIELLAIAAFVGATTIFLYGRLVGFTAFWDAQNVWSILLFLGWLVISLGYFHQGFKVRAAGDAREVSFFLPAAVFIVQCILFIKGIYYHDWSLVVGAVMVNAGVLFSLYQIVRANWFMKK